MVLWFCFFLWAEVFNSVFYLDCKLSCTKNTTAVSPLLITCHSVFCSHVPLVADRMTISLINPQTHEKAHLNRYYYSVISQLFTGHHRPLGRDVHRGNVDRLWPVTGKFLVSKSVIILVGRGLNTSSSEAAFSLLKQINKRGRCQ